MACQVPVPSGASPSPGTVVISFRQPARTIVADWSSLITSYQVVLTSHDGSPGRTLTAQPGTSATFTSVTPGTWDVGVTALNGTVVIGTGSLTGQQLGTSSSLSLTVPVSGTQTGTGNFSLQFTIPTSAGVDYLSAQLFTVPGNTAVGAPLVPTLATIGSLGAGTLAQTGLTSGCYRLEISFYRGGSASGTLAGVYSEAVNIWDNVTSSSWITPTGALAAVRAFDASDFRFPGLANLTVTSGGSPVALGPTFSSWTTSYTAVIGPTFSVTPTPGNSALRIQYQQDSGVWTDLALGSATPSLGLSAYGTKVSVKVTGADGSTATYLLGLTPATAPSSTQFGVPDYNDNHPNYVYLDGLPVSTANSGQGILVSTWSKVPNPVISNGSLGNYEKDIIPMELWGTNWMLQGVAADIYDMASFGAPGVYTYNSNTSWYEIQFSGAPYDIANKPLYNYAGDATGYVSYWRTTDPQPPISFSAMNDWVFNAWQLIFNTDGSVALYQWTKFNDNTGLHPMGNTPEVTPIAILRSCLVSNIKGNPYYSITTDQANTWTLGAPTSLDIGGNVRQFVSRVTIREMDTKATDAQILAIAGNVFPDPTAWGDYPLNWVNGAVNLADQSGHGHTLILPSNAVLLAGPPGPQ